MDAESNLKLSFFST